MNVPRRARWRLARNPIVDITDDGAVVLPSARTSTCSALGLASLLCFAALVTAAIQIPPVAIGDDADEQLG